MNRPDHFELANDCAVYRPVGQVSLQEAVKLVTAAIAFAREQRIEKLLVVATGLVGFVPPNLGSRYFLAKEWAEASGGAVRIAVVVRPEMIDPGKFGVTVARNNGLTSNVFASEEEARIWLLSRD